MRDLQRETRGPVTFWSPRPLEYIFVNQRQLAGERCADVTTIEEVLLEIVSCEIAGQTACVMVRDGYLGMTFLDTLSFLKVDGQWKIYNKLYHVEKE